MDKKNNHILMIISTLGLFAIALFAPQLTQAQQLNPNTISSSSTSISSTTTISTISTTSTSSTTSLTSTTTIVPIATSTTNRWLGYSIGFGGNTTYITANWTVPNVTKGNMIQWIGIQSVATGRLIQVGVSGNSAGLSNSYHAFYERYPNEDMVPSFNLSAGDSIKASIMENANGTWQVYLKDLTANRTISIQVIYNITDSEPMWTIEAPYWDAQGSADSLGNFSSTTFTNVNAVINGKSANLCDKNLTGYLINGTSIGISNCMAFSVSNAG